MSETSQVVREAIQKVATGPRYSKDLGETETAAVFHHLLSAYHDPVQAAVILVALRMKRETREEYRGIMAAIRAATNGATAPVPDVVDVADPYDGQARGLPASPFLPAVLAACGVPAVSHGVEELGPKHGVTHRRVLRAAGVNVDLGPAEAAARLGTAGWAYVDQSRFCPGLYNLIPLRERIVKRTALTTNEVMAGPIRGQRATRLVTGYVHQAYPAVYTDLAAHAGFSSALVVRGMEGGVIPSLQQEGTLFHWPGGDAEPEEATIDPVRLGIRSESRAVPLPSGGRDPAEAAAAEGVAALNGEPGPMRDSLVYGGALVLHYLGHEGDLPTAGERVARALDSGEAMKSFNG